MWRCDPGACVSTWEVGEGGVTQAPGGRDTHMCTEASLTTFSRSHMPGLSW